MFSGLSKRIRAQITGYILAALGLVAGLAWNEAIKELIDYLYPRIGEGLSAKFIYATAITVLVVIVGISLNREEKS